MSWWCVSVRAGNFLWLGEEEERGEQEGWAIVHRGCIFVRLALVAIVRREGERERRERKKKHQTLNQTEEHSSPPSALSAPASSVARSQPK